MNKKLFSWKALAGLALLVAMGMTSCKNTTEVDPNDPYNTTKPVKPGTSTAGDADLTFTLTNASGGDLTSLWNAWKKNNADAAKELMAEEEVTIALNFANYKLDGKEIAIPAFVTTPNGSIINIVVSGFAEAKKALNFNTKNLAGAEVNFTLPAEEFAMVLNAATTKVTLDGAATLTTLDATASTNNKLALDIEDGVTVEGIKMTGALASADNVEAKLINAAADAAIEKGKGFQVGSEKVYVKSAIVNTDVTISGADETALETITVAEGKTLTLGSKKSQIETIVANGDLAKNKIVFAGDKDDFSKIGAISNAHLNSTATTNIEDMSIFENVVFDMDVNLLDDTVADTEFNGDVIVKVGEDVDQIKFSNVNFGKKAWMGFTGSVEVTTSKSLVKMLQYSKADGKFVAVKNDDEDNLSAASKKGTEGTFTYEAWTYGWWDQDYDDILAQKIYLTDKFHFDAIEDAQDDLDAAKKAYDAEVAKNGYDATNVAGVKAYDDYKAAWEVLNGDSKAIIESGKAVKFEKASSQTKLGLYTDYKNEWAFVNDANKAIDGCDWFTINNYAKGTLEPEIVSLEFDDDCTIGGKDIDAEKLNSLCTWPRFSSVADAWLVVSYGDTIYKWAKTTGNTYLLK